MQQQHEVLFFNLRRKKAKTDNPLAENRKGKKYAKHKKSKLPTFAGDTKIERRNQESQKIYQYNFSRLISKE